MSLLAGFAGAAQAADSVTLYGLIDAGIGYEQVKFNGDKQSRFGAVQGVSSGSRFGMRGVEDLGDGLRAVFNLEAGFGPLNGNSQQNGRLFGRQATVGLDSDYWGRLEFGRQPTWHPSSSVRSIRSRSATTPLTWVPRSAPRTRCVWTTWSCIKPRA
ncbi:porin [Bordetella holmesii]|nr:porin [Bordetella holmesii]AWP94703.1 porin [Bordetella holmesii]QJP54698.1 porin [Bordetella holmesii]QJP64381.1 porin [Bordetella holmesii]